MHLIADTLLVITFKICNEEIIAAWGPKSYPIIATIYIIHLNLSKIVEVGTSLNSMSKNSTNNN